MLDNHRNFTIQQSTANGSKPGQSGVLQIVDLEAVGSIPITRPNFLLPKLG